MTTADKVTDILPGDVVDAVVVGGGAAGLGGALMLARLRRSVVVIDSGTPRNAPAEGVHALLGLDGMPPAELLRRGREEVRSYGGRIVAGEVTSATPDMPSTEGDPRFTITLTDGRSVQTRRVLVATGLQDILPDIPGLAPHWGEGVVHCPFCHGWEVRDEPIGVLAAGPGSILHAQLFRQLTEDLVYFTHNTDLGEDTRALFAARGIRVIDTPVTEVCSDETGITGVQLTDGQIVPRRVVTVLTWMQARTDGLDGLRLPMADLPGGMGRSFVTGMAGTTEVPGVWVAGNATDLAAQVGAAAAAGALAASHMSADLAIADTNAALAPGESRATPPGLGRKRTADEAHLDAPAW